MKKFTYSLMIAFAAILFSGTAFGQITHVNSQTASVTSTTITITKPTGLTVGDVMIANILQGENDDDGGLNDATGTDWVEIDGRSLETNTNQTLGWRTTVLYKIATQADVNAANFTFTLDGDANDRNLGGISAFRGVDNANPFDAANGTINVITDDVLAATTKTTVTANSAILMLGMISDDRNFSNWATANPGVFPAINELYDVVGTATNDFGSSIGASWALKPATGATGAGSASLSVAGDIRTGSILIALRPYVDPQPNSNLWSVSGTGALRKYIMDPVLGTLIAGPSTVATPLTSTAAVAKNQIIPGVDAEGCIYYLNRDDASTLNGVVTVYSMRPNGSGHGSRGTIDMNGAGNNDDFSFVRLGFDALGRGWILAGSGSNIYIASFQGNGVNAISGINTFGNASLTVAAPGSATDFQNGDLAITANGTMYAVANITDAATYVYTLNSLSTPTTLTRKWLVQQDPDGPGGNAPTNFTGSVNGLAWTQSGSLHFSTSVGIYFIDQFTANTGSGTVLAALVAGTGGLELTDLGSDRFPTQTTLPVDLISFAGAYSNQKTNLNWVTENLQDFDRFEVERSSDGSNFVTVATKAPVQTAARTTYLHTDDLSAVNGTVFYYRLKMIDLNGQFKYSNVILVRKESNVKGIRINPNPVVTGGVATLRFEASAKGVVEFRIVDMAGRIVLRQQNNVAEGINSVPVNSLDRLQPGTYILQMNDGTTIQSTKFIVAQ